MTAYISSRYSAEEQKNKLFESSFAVIVKFERGTSSPSPMLNVHELFSEVATFIVDVIT